MTGDELCVVCGGQVELTEHVIRDCSWARAVWFHSLGIRVETNHRMSLLHWMEHISVQFPSHGFKFCLMLIWFIWKHKNEVFWSGTSLPPHEIVIRTEGWMFEFHKWHKSAGHKGTREIQKWCKPRAGRLKCNFDGAWSQNGPRRAFGFVIRNHFGISWQLLQAL